MKKIRTVLIVLSGLYVLTTLIFLFNEEALFNNFNLLRLIDYLQAWIMVGLLLLISVIVVGTLYINALQQRYKKLETEHKGVKARLFDIEEERKSEIVRRQTDEEETERKLGAFNQSLKNKNKPEEGDGDRPPLDAGKAE